MRHFALASGTTSRRQATSTSSSAAWLVGFFLVKNTTPQAFGHGDVHPRHRRGRARRRACGRRRLDVGRAGGAEAGKSALPLRADHATRKPRRSPLRAQMPAVLGRGRERGRPRDEPVVSGPDLPLRLAQRRAVRMPRPGGLLRRQGRRHACGGPRRRRRPGVTLLCGACNGVASSSACHDALSSSARARGRAARRRRTRRAAPSARR